jgi:hypothetical protein
MTELRFTALDIVAEPFAVAPQLTTRLRIEETTGTTIHAIALRCQVRIEPQRRPYAEADEGGLRGLFGERARWRETLRPFLWMHCSAMVQGFTGSTEVNLPMPCTFDFEVTGSKYLHALHDGAIPLSLLFSGTIFTRGRSGFGVEQVGWDSEASYSLPVAVWRRMIELNYPGTGWLRLDRDVLSALARYQADHGLTSFDDAITSLLATAPTSRTPAEEGVS